MNKSKCSLINIFQKAAEPKQKTLQTQQLSLNEMLQQDALLQVLYIRVDIGGQLDKFIQYFKR